VNGRLSLNNVGLIMELEPLDGVRRVLEYRYTRRGEGVVAGE
jgi:hypothetical protein